MADEVPFQPLPARMAGLPLDTTSYDGVPDWLIDPLRDWIAQALDGDDNLARRIAMRLRWTSAIGRGYTDQLIWCGGDQLLTVIDAILQLNTSLWQMVHLLKHRPDINQTDPRCQHRCAGSPS